MDNVSQGFISVGGKGLSWEQTQLLCQSIWGWAVPGELLIPRMTEGKAGAAACFGLVTKRIRKIFRHFPKSKPWPVGLRLPRRPSREVLLVTGRLFWGGSFWVGFAGFLLLFGMQGLS